MTCSERKNWTVPYICNHLCIENAYLGYNKAIAMACMITFSGFKKSISRKCDKGTLYTTLKWYV